MKETAVEWLLDNLISEPYSEEDFKYNRECWDKAVAMEKEQIIYAHLFGLVRPLEMEATKQADKYYNETFKSE